MPENFNFTTTLRSHYHYSLDRMIHYRVKIQKAWFSSTSMPMYFFSSFHGCAFAVQTNMLLVVIYQFQNIQLGCVFFPV